MKTLEELRVHKMVMMDMFFYILDMLFSVYKSINYLISYPYIRHIYTNIIYKFFRVHKNNNHTKYICVYFRQICGYLGINAFNILKYKRYPHNRFSVFLGMFFDFFVANRSVYCV